MRLNSLTSLVLLCVGAVTLVAAAPDIVAKYPEALNLWTHVENNWLPIAHLDDHLKGVPTDVWHTFLRRKGKGIVEGM